MRDVEDMDNDDLVDSKSDDIVDVEDIWIMMILLI